MRYKTMPILRLVILCICCVIAASSIAQTTFPVPKDSRERLFYLQRDPNSNTVIYDMNYLEDGSVDMDDPVHVYWIKYAKGGVQEDLLAIEKYYAYGARTELADETSRVFKMNLAAYKKISILLKPGPDKHYAAYVSVNGKTMMLTRVFLKIDGGSKMKPNVKYIEFTGKDTNTGLPLAERVKP